ncbi:hypothetical protein WM40_04130 [Robbsia andropogonis]|uniref:Capsular biosynthesis protein n=1 Tax=Robbsia andropogonis TaxID=28092 RepID=A0A0F5K3H0_9BURK|nr:capsular polysaccharide synthesis protein [Robbsia andropogonis]KKB64623.1 hypothetical protein WM40_04130 [Robbsia andropogonis]MCP1117789.1 capsular polysaccharide synthesis protein [Robbsia andropogonis]MCP1127254.1 capsular polysaccharide synthesis protein [Robbsia andropogonis]
MANVRGAPRATTTCATDTRAPLTVPLLLWSSEHDDSPPRDTAPIPPLFWTYWHDASLPLVVQACLRSWRHHHPDKRITILHPDTLPDELPALPEGFRHWPPQVQSDWVRLAVLATHGGVWLDASTLMHAPLHFIDTLAARHRPDLIGYFNRERTQDAAFPMLENWFLAAPANSAFVRRWWAMFDGALHRDGTADMASLSNGTGLPTLLQGFSHAPAYFTCHAAAQRVMRDGIAEGNTDRFGRHDGATAAENQAACLFRTHHSDHGRGIASTDAAVLPYRLALMPAELDAFYETHSRGWEPDRVCSWLCDAPGGPAAAICMAPDAPDRAPVALFAARWSTSARLTKLIGLLWRPLEARLQRGDVHPASIIGCLLP